MNKILILIFVAVFVLSSCISNSQNASNEVKNFNESVKSKIVSVKGKVTEILRGKDGYTAKIVTDNGKTYSAVISSVNMSGSGQYREVKVGDVIEVEGDVLGDGTSIVVTSLD